MTGGWVMLEIELQPFNYVIGCCRCFVVHAGECSSSTMTEHRRRGVLCVWLSRGRYVTDAGGFSTQPCNCVVVNVAAQYLCEGI